MNITFLFGNGFDIRVGLESSFETIIESYCKTESTSENISKFKKAMQDNPKLWSDFEMQMGKYTAEYGPNDRTEYDDCINDFTVYFVKYLTAEESSVDYSNNQTHIVTAFKRFLLYFFSELTPRYLNMINNKIINTPETVTYNIISFNYTHILDKCIELAFQDNDIVGNHSCRSIKYDHKINKKVYHIHGELPGPIIMGLDSKKQIANKAWSETDHFCDRYVKPTTNIRYGSMIDDEITTLINNSSIICIFGMSLGETDGLWWRTIVNSVVSKDRYIIVYGYDKAATENNVTLSNLFDFQDQIRDRFIQVANVREEFKKDIQKKIHPIQNTEHLNLQLVPKDKIHSA